MTAIQKAIFTEIKTHNANYDYLSEYNKGIKFVSMGRYNRDEFTVCSDGNTMVKYLIKCRFKAPKYENNVVIYMVNIYSDGSMGIYFDGTEYQI